MLLHETRLICLKKQGTKNVPPVTPSSDDRQVRPNPHLMEANMTFFITIQLLSIQTVFLTIFSGGLNT